MFVGSDDSGSSDLTSYYYIGCDNRHELGSDALVFWRNRRLLHRLLGSRGHHLFRNDPRFLRMWRSRTSLISPSPGPPHRSQPRPSDSPPAAASLCFVLTVFNATHVDTYAVLHGTTAFNAAHVDTWNGTTFIVPVISAFLADSCWGKAWCCSPCPRGSRRCGRRRARGSRAHRPPGSSSPLLRGAVPDLHRHGGVKSALLPFAAEQYDVDGGPEQAPRKQSFFTWFFGAINLGIFVTGTLVSWLQPAAERVMGARLRGLRPLPAPGGDWLPTRHALVQDSAARRPQSRLLLHRPSADRCRCQVLTLAGRDASQNDDVGHRRGYPTTRHRQ
ncbi:hypothetical protein QYE76_004891 [Lolium multiflorum]|uniref:Uncharacterized protein n=1 Tax=Lolium multiflorum TaxID=4521 RepID=A0AAD8RRL5_LOLMU|nr:hypothetical protein QYE76_004891 [Lolium multiflorum]